MRDDGHMPEGIAGAEFLLHDVRIVVLNLPDEDLVELHDALGGLCQDYVGNEGWAEISGGERPVVFWRGWVAGGIASVYLALAPALVEHELEVLLSDNRIDVVTAGGADDVVINGLYRVPRVMSAEQFRALAVEALTPDDLVHRLMAFKWADEDRLGFARREANRTKTEDAADGELWQRPRVVTQVAPGHIDWGYLDESDCQVVDDYDPEGSLTDSRAIFTCGAMTTQVIPPAVFEPEIEPHQTDFRWRAFQFDADEEEPTVALEIITVERTLEVMPGRSATWVRDLTREAIEQATAVLEDCEEDFDIRRDRDALAHELRLAFPEVEGA